MEKIAPFLILAIMATLLAAFFQEVSQRDSPSPPSDEWAVIHRLQVENTKLRRLVKDAYGKDYKNQPVYRMVVDASAYSARPEETNANPEVTSSMRPSRVGAIAVSRDLEALGLNLGDHVVIKDLGLFRIEDRMNRRWEKRIDILHANVKAARLFGRQKVELVWLGDNY